MKPRQGLVSTAQNYLSTSTASKSQYKCQNCHLIFQSPIQLYNHTKKFCTDSGFDTLAGLNIKLKNPTYGMGKIQPKRKLNDSLTNALEQIEKNKSFMPMENQLKNDFINLQRHQQDLKYARPYMYTTKNNNDLNSSNAKKSRSLYQSAKEENNQKNNYGQKANYNNKYLYEPQRSKAYSFTSSYLQKFKESNTYVSPPTQIPQQQNAKQFSLLDRSDMSIKMMPQQQKKDYVIRKILQLQQIEQGYKNNGGKNDKFVENTIKMKKFYQQLLDKINNQRGSIFGCGKISNGTRVSTPILKLDKLQQSRNLIESIVRPEGGKQSIIKSKISQIQQKNMIKRNDQVRKRFHTQVEGRSQKNINMTNDILDDEMLRKISSNSNNERQNQIIVIPMQQPQTIPQNYIQNNQQKSYQTQLTVKYIQSLSALKDEQNKNFLQILQRQNQEMKKMYQAQIKNKQKSSSQNEKKIKALENKYLKLKEKIDRQRQKQQRNLLYNRQNNNLPINSDIIQNQNNFRISRMKSNNNRRYKTQYSYSNNDENYDKQYRQLHPQIDNVRLLNLQSPGYHSQQYEELSPQERLLLQMQKQQRDQLQLFAHLPLQIQKIKQKSIQQLSQKRFQMEKQVIKQKLQKLKLSQEMKAFQLQRKLLSEEMETQKKKITIHKLMKKKIKQMVKEEFQEQQKQNDYLQDEEEQNEGNYL